MPPVVVLIVDDELASRQVLVAGTVLVAYLQGLGNEILACDELIIELIEGWSFTFVWCVRSGICHGSIMAQGSPAEKAPARVFVSAPVESCSGSTRKDNRGHLP